MQWKFPAIYLSKWMYMHEGYAYSNYGHLQEKLQPHASLHEYIYILKISSYRGIGPKSV
jgi:hypothetical protein